MVQLEFCELVRQSNNHYFFFCYSKNVFIDSLTMSNDQEKWSNRKGTAVMQWKKV